MIIGFGNNVVSSLAADITATQTTIQVMPGAGALFAGLLSYDYANDSNPLKTYAKITLTDAKETVFEVCHLTAVNNDMLTVVRGQEGSDRKGWSLNDVIANFATRGSENQFVQIEQLQSGHYTSAVAGGTENGLTLALPATYFLNGSTDWALKTPILIYPTLSNTGASTLQLTMGGRVMGTYPLVKGSNTALRAGDIVAKNPFLVVFNVDQGRFVVLNPSTDVGSVRSVNNHGPGANGDVELPDASTTEKGLTQLSSATDSDSETLAATPKAVKVTHDLAAAALPLTGGTMTDEIKSTSANILRGIQGGYGAILRMDANGLYFLQTNKDDPNGNYNDKRSLTISNDTGAVGIGTQLTVTNADFINKVGYTTYTGGDGHNHAQVGGLRLEVDGSQLAELYYNVDTTSQSAEVSLHNKYGTTDSYLSLRNDGQLAIVGSWPAITMSTGTTWHPDGNIQGSCWEGDYLSNWLLTKVMPVGAALPWPQETPPPGWLLCNGSGFDRNACPRLAGVFPNGILPDYRGVFLRGKDNTRGIDPNRALGDFQASQAPASAIGGGNWNTYAGRDTGHTATTGSDNSLNYRVLQETEQQRETRPANVSVNYIVRAA